MAELTGVWVGATRFRTSLWGCDPMKPMAGEDLPLFFQGRARVWLILWAVPTGVSEEIEDQHFEEFRVCEVMVGRNTMIIEAAGTDIRKALQAIWPDEAPERIEHILQLEHVL